MMMTQNMLTAIERHEFRDASWVDQLLNRFADYYFDALEAYEQNPTAAPSVWQLAFDATRQPRITPIQSLLLGVNAHINYDLVFTLTELLKPEWLHLSAQARADRYADHCHVNEVIGCTIDAVQDQVLEPAMPVMDMVDKLFGSLDERLVSRLITHWRESVWHNALRLVEVSRDEEQTQVIQDVEADALRIARIIS